MNHTQRPAELAKQPLALAPELLNLDLDLNLGNLGSEIGQGHTETLSSDTSHTLFAPLHYEPGYSYPLIVWLHGPGNDERQLVRIMPLVSMRNYVAVSPRGLPMPEISQSTHSATAHSVARGFTWSQSEAHIQVAQKRIFDCIHTAKQKFNIAPHRVFLAGFDCGGTMAFRVAMDHPERFAGVLSLGGAFPQGRTPFRNLTSIRRLPVFLAVGRDSEVYSPEAACHDLRLFHSAGMSITLRQFPFGHELAPQMLADIDRWVIDQITGAGKSEG